MTEKQMKSQTDKAIKAHREQLAKDRQIEKRAMTGIYIIFGFAVLVVVVLLISI